MLYFVLQKILTHVKQVVRSSPAFCNCPIGYTTKYRVTYLHLIESKCPFVLYLVLQKILTHVNTKQVVRSGSAFCNWGQLQNAGRLQTTCSTCRIIHLSHQLTQCPFPCFLAKWYLWLIAFCSLANWQFMPLTTPQEKNS